MNNKNNKIYIGVTINPKQRWRGHCSPSSGCIALRGAIKKYGVDNFKMEVLCQGTTEYIEELEIDAIKSYKSRVPNGYNIQAGGQGGNATEWNTTWNTKLGSKSDAALAEELDVGRDVVKTRRGALGIPAYTLNKKNVFLNSFKDQLGVATDAELARISDSSSTAIRRYRNELNTKSKSRLDTTVCESATKLMGRLPDHIITNFVALSTATIHRLRVQANIPTLKETLSRLEAKEQEEFLQETEVIVGQQLFTRYTTPKGSYLSFNLVCEIYKAYSEGTIRNKFYDVSQPDWSRSYV